jgi:hypothetical protein
MVAKAAFEELQVTEFVMFCCGPLEKVPVAVKGWVCPFATVAEEGDTEIAVSVPAVTVTTVDPRNAPLTAVMVAVPEAKGVT